MRVCALVVDLMDRSRISAAVPGAVFVRDAVACAGADVVIVDLARSGQHVSVLRPARRRRRCDRGTRRGSRRRAAEIPVLP
jgi:hypothetical protein